MENKSLAKIKLYYERTEEEVDILDELRKLWAKAKRKK